MKPTFKLTINHLDNKDIEIHYGNNIQTLYDFVSEYAEIINENYGDYIHYFFEDKELKDEMGKADYLGNDKDFTDDIYEYLLKYEVNVYQLDCFGNYERMKKQLTKKENREITLKSENVIDTKTLRYKWLKAKSKVERTTALINYNKIIRRESKSLMREIEKLLGVKNGK